MKTMLWTPYYYATGHCADTTYFKVDDAMNYESR